MNEAAPDLPEDLKTAAWEDTATVWLNNQQPRNLDQEEERTDLIQVLANWTDRDPADIQPYWPRIKEEVVAAQGVFGVRHHIAPPAIPPQPPSDE